MVLDHLMDPLLTTSLHMFAFTDIKLEYASIIDKKNQPDCLSRNGDIPFSFRIVTFGPLCIYKCIFLVFLLLEFLNITQLVSYIM